MTQTRLGKVLFWEGGSLWIALTNVRSDFHAHHAIQLAIGLTNTLQLRTRKDSDWQHYVGALIPPNLEHSFQAPDVLVANLFCAPESSVGRILAARLAPKVITPLDAKTTAALAHSLNSLLRQDADDEALKAAAKSCFTRLIDGAIFATPTDPRVERAIAEIQRRVHGPISLADIAETVNLSEGRFRHLFVSDTGLPFRAYVLWARLNKALELGFGGASWTEAAHATNFADAAHLTRTCQRMYGFAPTHAQRGRQVIELNSSIAS